ncbi:protein SIEVE ELEMENT OCCLUSION B isoform X1 [Ziziphus jujuba]|uniref:Protein SIEVE ELEMENT OCCLUSION B isoform X1 n=1 Tax=Ziziphus jujuba TaxID=326968 RepID=A0ABM3IS08_ZIZJJ|nr:protein SIEVE ELEMENT OCCLUSION B isoform X1 [Ziziphus jujuba]
MFNIAHHVATKVVSAVHHVEEEIRGLFTLTDEKIMDHIYETHAHADETFDDDSLFIITENILKPATQIVDKIVQGSQVHVDNIDQKTPKPDFSVPLCTLKQIGSELSCKAPGEDIAHKTTLAILKKLSTYQWEAKAVLTLAAFALEYGDFWLLAQNQHSDHLAKSLGILKRVPILTKPAELQKRRQAILELNNLIKATLQVMEIIDQFDKLSIYDPKEITGLSVALDHIPVDVYWSIVTVVACSTKLTLLTSDEDKPYDLAPYSQKIHYVLNKLKIQLVVCRRQVEERETYLRLKKFFQTPTEVMEIFKALTFTKDKPQLLIDGSTNTTVSLEVLKKKKIFLFISTLEITEEDILYLKPVHEGTKRDENYKIVWIPMVDNWTPELQKKFEILRSKMPWYTIQSISVSVGIKFIKEEWNFKGKPSLVVMNHQGKIENTNALHLVKLWGIKAFPFDKAAEEKISSETSWIRPVILNIDSHLSDLMLKEEKYIFFYGGKDNEWIKQFTAKANAFANDPIFKEAKINIDLFCVGKSPKGGEDHGILGRFWDGIESLFVTKAHKQVDPVTQEIQKLLSYKNESGWALLTKGPHVVTAGHGFTILKVLDDLEKWKEVIKEKGFEISFKEYHVKLIQSVRHCCRLDIPSVIGKVPEKMQCPECPRTMESFISYKCCHIDGPIAHH